MKNYIATGTCETCGKVVKCNATTEQDARVMLVHDHYWDARCVFSGEIQTYEGEPPRHKRRDHAD